MAELRIKEILKDKGWTQARLADEMHISPIALNRMLKRGKPNFDALERMADALQVEVPDLFRRDSQSITCPNCGALIEINVKAKE